MSKSSDEASSTLMESVLGYNFEHDKLYNVLTSPKKDERAVYVWSVAGLVRALAHIGLLTN